MSASTDSTLRLWGTSRETRGYAIEPPPQPSHPFKPSCLFLLLLLSLLLLQQPETGSPRQDHSAKATNDRPLVLLIDNAQVRVFSGHRNTRNFVGMAVDKDFIACGSELTEVFVYYKVSLAPLHLLPSLTSPAPTGRPWRACCKSIH